VSFSGAPNNKGVTTEVATPLFKKKTDYLFFFFFLAFFFAMAHLLSCRTVRWSAPSAHRLRSTDPSQ